MLNREHLVRLSLYAEVGLQLLYLTQEVLVLNMPIMRSLRMGRGGRIGL